MRPNAVNLSIFAIIFGSWVFPVQKLILDFQALTGFSFHWDGGSRLKLMALGATPGALPNIYVRPQCSKLIGM